MMSACNHWAEQVSAFIDGELTQQQCQFLAQHLEGCAQCRKLRDDLLKLRNMVGQSRWENPSQRQLEKIMNDFTARATAISGWILLLIGLLPAALYGLYEFFARPEIPLWLRITYGAAALGLGLLFASVLRQRLINRKTDKYTQVQL